MTLALFSRDGQAWDAVEGTLAWKQPTKNSVGKITVGKARGRNDEPESIELAAPLPGDFAKRFPELTHLHLWQIENLTELPQLPNSLRTLDVRDCPNLKTLPVLPDGLQTLILVDCPAARNPSNQESSFPQLVELRLARSTSLSQDWIRSVLSQAPNLRMLDLAGCSQVCELAEFPLELVDIRLDDCKQLTVLPAHWPPMLRRVGLRGARCSCWATAARARRASPARSFPAAIPARPIGWAALTACGSKIGRSTPKSTRASRRSI